MEATDWRTANLPDAPVFEVYRAFTPLREAHGRGGRGAGGGHHGMADQAGGGSPLRGGTEEKPEGFVLVGLDQKPLQEALAADLRNTVLSAIVVAALGLGGFISMFWAHHYRRSSRLLMDTQALASEVVTSLPVGLIASNAEGIVGIANAPALAMLGKRRDEVVGRSLADLPALNWAVLAAELAKGGKVLERETELTTPGENAIPIRLSASQTRNAEGVFLGHIFILGDIGEVKRLQSEIHRNERLTALGNLAAGVAHEVRNPLSTIKGLATYLAGRLPKGGREEETAKTLISEANRLNAVVSELLEFARPSVAEDATPADVNAVIAHALRLAATDIKDKGIIVTFTPDPLTPRVRLNPARMTQALLNLFLNAVQAMSQGGTLRICAGIEPGSGELSIAVEDNGAGMPEEVRESIFNPYFTTKTSGTGLGLAVVHQIVDAHGGKIAVRSSPGAGSTFTIHLPLGKDA